MGRSGCSHLLRGAFDLGRSDISDGCSSEHWFAPSGIVIDFLQGGNYEAEDFLAHSDFGCCSIRCSDGLWLKPINELKMARIAMDQARTQRLRNMNPMTGIGRDYSGKRQLA
jgi:hypothetical protein